MRIAHWSLPLVALLPLMNGCARKEVAVVAAPPPPPPVPVPVPRPQPPMGAAANLTLPMPAADGSVATPNTGLTAAATQWHLRAALNVAALQCGKAGDPIEASYNQFLKTHEAALAKAHKTLAGEYRSAHGKNAQDAFDDGMTRLYNFYAQPPVRSGFCAAAQPLVTEAATITDLSGFAPRALAALDVPFADFYRAYASYRVDLAAWQAGQAGQPRTMLAAAAVPQPATPAATAAPTPTAPRIEVDGTLLMADTRVTMRGRVQTASR